MEVKKVDLLECWWVDLWVAMKESYSADSTEIVAVVH